MLERVLKRIKSRILDQFPLSNAAHGGVHGRSPLTNASVHLAQPTLANIDIRKFFDNLHHEMVYRMFRHRLGFGRDVASLLTRLTTFDGRLPQGSPTSTAIANLVLSTSIDDVLATEAERLGLRYTRFVDDISISGAAPQLMIGSCARALSTLRLPIHRASGGAGKAAKLKVTPRAKRQAVTGLSVNRPDRPSVARAYRDMIRASVHSLKDVPAGVERDSRVRSVRGQIAYVKRTNPGSAARLTRQLEAFLSR